MPDIPVSVSARREAVQPSLWDRLIDDLPGLAAEAEALAAQLRRELGDNAVSRLLSGGRRVIEQEPDLEELHRRELRDLIALEERRAVLRERAVVVTPSVLREAVRRDLEALFGVERLEAVPLLTDAEAGWYQNPAALLASFPEVRRSVLNYGVPSFAGRQANDFDADQLSRELRSVIALFEPRLRSDSITVKVDTTSREGLRIEVEGVLMLSPVPERLRLSTTIDLDSGRAATQLVDA